MIKLYQVIIEFYISLVEFYQNCVKFYQFFIEIGSLLVEFYHLSLTNAAKTIKIYPRSWVINKFLSERGEGNGKSKRELQNHSCRAVIYESRLGG